MSGERRGRPWAAVGILVLTLAVTALASWLALVFSLVACWGCSTGKLLTFIVILFIPVASWLVWGLVWAWKVATGRTRDIWGNDNRGFDAADARPVWTVAEPGAEASHYIRGDLLAGYISGDSVAGYFAAGTTVTEVRRTGSRVLVCVDDGLSGWVDAERLQPPVPPTGEREGGG